MKSALFFLLLLSFSSAHAVEGTERGGGDAANDRIRKLEKFIGKEGAWAKRSVLMIAEQFNLLAPRGKMSKQLQDLVQAGLLEDIRASKYELSPICKDSQDVERSASTEMVYAPNIGRVHPPICINARKLVAEGASNYEILALILHEHARHFGLDDTDSVGIHPIAEFVAKKAEAISERRFWEAQSVMKDVAFYQFTSILNESQYVNFYSSVIEGVTLSIESLSGKGCRRKKVEIWKDFHCRTAGRLEVGATFKLGEGLLAFWSPDCRARFRLSRPGSGSAVSKEFDLSNSLKVEGYSIDMTDVTQ